MRVIDLIVIGILLLGVLISSICLKNFRSSQKNLQQENKMYYAFNIDQKEITGENENFCELYKKIKAGEIILEEVDQPYKKFNKEKK